jgi:hypothetical protein
MATHRLCCLGIDRKEGSHHIHTKPQQGEKKGSKTEKDGSLCQNKKDAKIGQIRKSDNQFVNKNGKEKHDT